MAASVRVAAMPRRTISTSSLRRTYPDVALGETLFALERASPITLGKRIATGRSPGVGIIRAAAMGRPQVNVRFGRLNGGSVATKRQVEQKLRQLIKQLDEADVQVHGTLTEALPESRIIQVTIPDIDATYWTELSGGRMGPLHSGAPRQSEIQIRVSSDNLVELVEGRRSLFSAFVAGQVKIDASFSDMMKLRRLA